jgi:hypothetical protein
VKVVESGAHHSTAYITDGGLRLAQNSVNLKAAAHYGIVCIIVGDLRLT